MKGQAQGKCQDINLEDINVVIVSFRLQSWASSLSNDEKVHIHLHCCAERMLHYIESAPSDAIIAVYYKPCIWPCLAYEYARHTCC